MSLQRIVNGMHLSNGRQWFIEQCLEAAHPTGTITMLHFQGRDDPVIQQGADYENLGWYHKLRFGWAPQGIAPAPERLSPVVPARFCRSYLLTLEERWPLPVLRLVDPERLWRLPKS